MSETDSVLSGQLEYQTGQLDPQTGQLEGLTALLLSNNCLHFHRGGGWCTGFRFDAQPVVDEPTGYRELLGNLGQMVSVEPAGLLQLLTLHVQFSTVIVGMEAHHQSAGVGPGLRAEITYVLDADARLFHHLAPYGLLQRLPRFHETGYQPEEIAPEVAPTGQQHLLATVYEHDDGRSQLRPHLLTTLVATLGNVGMELHGSSADTTEACVAVPVEQFGTFAGFQIEGKWQPVVTLAQGTHLVALIVADRAVDGVGTHLNSIQWGNVQYCGPWFQLYGRLLGQGNGEGAVGALLKHQLVLAEYEIISFHLSCSAGCKWRKVSENLQNLQIYLLLFSVLCTFAADFKNRTMMMNGKFKVALFDLDGVVFDTEPQYTIFWGEQCREFHPEHPGLEIEIKGQTLTQIYDRWFSGELEGVRDLVTSRLNAYEAEMDYPYVEGFVDFIGNLRRKGVKTAVVTSSNRPKMEVVYQKHPEFATLFDAILTSEDFAESKPSPDCYLKGASRFGAKPDECVVFEDSINGLRSGRAAGMYVVGLTTTNDLNTIKQLSDTQINNYRDNNKYLNALWQVI